MSGESPDWPREFARRLHCVRVVYFPFARTRARGGALRGALSRAASDWSARRVRYARLRASGCIADSRVEGDVTLSRGCKNARDGCYNATADADPTAVSYGFHAGQWGRGSTERDEEARRNLANVFAPRMLRAHLALLGTKRRKAR